MFIFIMDAQIAWNFFQLSTKDQKNWFTW